MGLTLGEEDANQNGELLGATHEADDRQRARSRSGRPYGAAAGGTGQGERAGRRIHPRGGGSARRRGDTDRRSVPQYRRFERRAAPRLQRQHLPHRGQRRDVHRRHLRLVRPGRLSALVSRPRRRSRGPGPVRAVPDQPQGAPLGGRGRRRRRAAPGRLARLRPGPRRHRGGEARRRAAADRLAHAAELPRPLRGVRPDSTGHRLSRAGGADAGLLPGLARHGAASPAAATARPSGRRPSTPTGRARSTHASTHAGAGPWIRRPGPAGWRSRSRSRPPCSPAAGTGPASPPTSRASRRCST